MTRTLYIVGHCTGILDPMDDRNLMHGLRRLRGPEAPPCPLDLHLLAPEVAEMVRETFGFETLTRLYTKILEFCKAPDLLVPVTLRIRNAWDAQLMKPTMKHFDLRRDSVCSFQGLWLGPFPFTL